MLKPLSRKNAGDSIPFWANIRREIIARDRCTCRICGDNDGNAGLNVHHIDYNRAHNQQSNLVTLCGPCHRAVHQEGYKPALFEDWPVPWGEQPSDNPEDEIDYTKLT